ncbi:MAG: protein kinase [Verrucomicrobiae bacterium]|nr:protein kinase [Verrucomicrobiae bacterium]
MPERYEIRGKVARGGIGAIYRAYDTRMGREVAIKRLLPLDQTHLNESADESLKREAAALAKFQHPNVITIFAFEEDDEGPYVVMEMVEGETLKETVGRAALPVEDFIELTLQVLDPLVAARDLNILHRDIKPSNIMISWLTTGRFQIKVLDFGLAKFSQQPSTQTLDQTGSFLGSIDYLAPEQLDLQPLDQRTDLYSLGCVLYFCLTQHPPFEGENAVKTMRNHLSHQVTHLAEVRPDVPKPIADWVMRMIARYPNQRPVDAREALQEFQIARQTPATEIPLALLVDEEEEEVPMATLVEDETPEPQPSEPIRVRTQPQLITSPPKNRTAPQLLVPKGSSGPVLQRPLDTGPRKSPTGAVKSGGTGPKKSVAKSAATESGSSKKAFIIGAILVAVVGIVIGLINSRGNDGESTKEAPKKADSPQDKPAAKASNQTSQPPAPAMPSMKNPPVAKPLAIPPVVSEGLVAHYAASDAVFAGDFIATAQPGDRITWWGNLHPTAASDHLLSVDPRHQDRGPKLTMATPADHPELVREVPVLSFERSTRLISQGRAEITKHFSGTSLTSFVVMRPDVDRAGVLRFEADEIGGVLSWDLSPAGHVLRMSKGSLQPSMEAKLGDLRDHFLIFAHVWNGEKVEQLLYVTLPNGKSVLAAAGDAPFKETPIHRYSLGGITSDPNAKTFVGDLAEWLIYDRALTDEEREAVAGQLASKYFVEGLHLTVDFVSPSPNGQKPLPRNAETNAETVAPAPPITAELVGHYAASDFTFGYDLRRPAEQEQRVMAWANLAPGTNADHLMAYQTGQEAETPILHTATPAEFPELNGSHSVLRFSAGETLEAKGGSQIQSKMDDREFTCLMVVQSDVEQAPILLFKSPTVDPAAAISVQPSGFAGMIRQGNEWKNTLAAAPSGTFVIASLTWHAAEGTHQLHLKLPDGTSVASSPMKTSVETHNIDGYRLGGLAGMAGVDRDFSGRVAEVLIYGKALPDRDREEVEAHLYQRYFAK